jgi:thymidylate kinase
LNEDKIEALALINLMPLPEAVVYIQVDVEENVKRILNRKKVLPVHKYLSKDELETITRNNHERWRIICEILENKRVPILRINSECNININVNKIMEFAGNLFTEGSASILRGENSLTIPK